MNTMRVNDVFVSQRHGSVSFLGSRHFFRWPSGCTFCTTGRFLSVFITQILAHILSQINSVHNLTPLLTPHSRDIVQKLIVRQLVKKFPEYYGIRRFFTVFTRARHLSIPEPYQSSPRPSNRVLENPF